MLNLDDREWNSVLVSSAHYCPSDLVLISLRDLSDLMQKPLQATSFEGQYSPNPYLQQMHDLTISCHAITRQAKPKPNRYQA
jgi:hypothetical protein